jgi:hypothetical protein
MSSPSALRGLGKKTVASLITHDSFNPDRMNRSNRIGFDRQNEFRQTSLARHPIRYPCR